jgi:hypothetical protein
MKYEVFLVKLQEVFLMGRVLFLWVLIVATLTQSCNPNSPRNPNPAPYKVPAPRVVSPHNSQVNSQADSPLDAKTHR